MKLLVLAAVLARVLVALRSALDARLGHGLPDPRLGVATVAAWATAGQTALSLAADHYGWFGREVTPISWLRLAGGEVIVVGSWMVLEG
jgi:uncharacterized membrane protein YdcZ (DUF606 family)